MCPEKDLKRKIVLEIEKQCRRGGLIKRVAGHKTYYETYDEKAEAFIEEFAEEIFKDYQAELAGLRKPFFAGPMGLERAISIACAHRINTPIRETILQRILKGLSGDEYIFSKVWDPRDNDEAESSWDAARPDNISSFPESPSGFNSDPADDFEEAWVRGVVEREHLKLQSRGKNGPMLYKVVLFYLDGHAESLNKWEEIGALSSFLQVDRKRARELKCRAFFLFFKGISKDLPLREAWKSFWHRRKFAKCFVRQSDRALLSTYSREREKKDPISLRRSIKDYSPEEIAELNDKYCAPDSGSFIRTWFLVCIGRRCASCRDSRCFRTTLDLEDAA